MLKLIVFDCDGVMFDSRDANIRYYNHLLAHFGLSPMTDAEENFVHINTVDDAIRHIFQRYPTPLEAVHDYKHHYGYGPFLKYLQIEPDLIKFLKITAKKCHLAISTNRTDTIIPLLKTYDLEQYFAKVVTAGTAKRPKPAPDGLLEILDYFGCAPKETIFIGDSSIDEQHAVACEVPFIAFKNDTLRATYYVNNFLEILKLPPCRTITQ